MQEGEKRLHTGAKKPENGTPRLRAKDQNCRDAAARPATTLAVSQTIITVVMTAVAALL
jgi:hypothetical protein